MLGVREEVFTYKVPKLGEKLKCLELERQLKQQELEFQRWPWWGLTPTDNHVYQLL
jgi:hypothetical protein